MKARLFCYGTLQNDAIFSAITGVTPARQSAVLHGYACYRVKRALYPGVMVSGQGLVPGTLYHGLNPGAINKLDRYEGDLYERQQLRVITDEGQPITAWVYVIKRDCRHLLTRDTWLYEEYESLFLERFFDPKGSQL